MNIDSVRELKQSLVQSQVEPMAFAAGKVSTLAVAAKPSRDLTPFRRSVALGVAPGKSGKDFRLAVRIQSRGVEGSAELERIRKAAKGEVEERFVGRVFKRAAPLRSRRRPLVIGCSIGHFRITAGTLGCFVSTKSGQRRALSNNHVLADENRGKKGDAVIQPGDFDGGTRPSDTMGALDRFVRLKKTAPNLVDAALATIRAGIAIDETTLDGLGDLQGVSTAPLGVGMDVHKVGRTTGTTSGRITAFELDNVVVTYDIGDLRFDDQVEIEGAGSGPFSRGGDSGSLIVDEGFRAVALLFAGGETGGGNGQGLTFANPIGAVLAALRVTLLP
ncbi:MAG TPA: hypothetical protein VGS57_11460 [Thermoanaerobaculia bacterium]|jgi:hypothetical protein|nr:hypothetical protein [Thermoanaerobaculia bacterium]